MKVDWEAFKRARRARDVRFDGKFFVASTTTKIYCRPSCNVPMIQDRYVRYFPNAAAAEEAGYRPCLRCRPEAAPGTPAWLGTSSTVSRALRLIAESGLDDGGIESLAERLGIGSRHLRRLFLRHVGATPSAMAQTRRLHFAKKLIDESNLPMNQIALAAGFGCVRRFNAAIQNTYHRTPSHIRRLARQAVALPENQYHFRLSFRPPYDWNAMLAFLAPRATPGVEIVENGKYRRTISVNNEHGWLEAALDERNSALEVRIHFPNPSSLFFIVERVRAMFDLNGDSIEIARCLGGDPTLGKLVRAALGLRVPGSWNGFELATRAILGQQITVKGATTLAGRVVTTFGRAISVSAGLTHLFPAAEVLGEADLRRAGVTNSRAETIRKLAQAVNTGRISFEGIVNRDDFVDRLREIPGIGEWTAQYIAMRALGEPDAFPAGDLGLVRASGAANSRELERRAAAWRPWRAYAAMYLWKSNLDSSVRKSKPARSTRGKCEGKAQSVVHLSMNPQSSPTKAAPSSEFLSGLSASTIR
ncbi:MAG TPA: AlkA N-terminal domain-containing protein [Terriglobales bacterium]|nr:AlkA N-terminal domain-containing protein [Terriglobales bacterium]